MTALLDALPALGVRADISPVLPRSTLNTLIILVDALDQPRLDQIRAAVGRTDRQVLVVVFDPDRLDQAACWRVLEAGVSDVIRWDGVRSTAEQVAARLRRRVQLDALLDSPAVHRRLVGDSAVWRRTIRRIVAAAAYSTVSMLITGESGTGKEQVARLVHELDPRADKGPFVVLDCTTVVPSLAGSEFFGHERGAFTGASSSRQGAFAQADGGTLFLDEVGELEPSLQAELLRVVQEGTYKRVGANTWHRTRFRLICATNRDLLAREAEGEFRLDFYHRIAAWHCQLPSLDERRDDILQLANHFAAEAADAPVTFDPAVSAFLACRSYPGNIRELRSLVQRIVSQHVGPGPMTVGDVAPAERPPTLADDIDQDSTLFDEAVRGALARGASLKQIRTLAAEAAVRLALQQQQGNIQRASRALAVTDRALQLRRARPVG